MKLTPRHLFDGSPQEGRDRALDMHTDDSDVTFNVCLGKDFEGVSTVAWTQSTTKMPL